MCCISDSKIVSLPIIPYQKNNKHAFGVKIKLRKNCQQIQSDIETYNTSIEKIYIYTIIDLSIDSYLIKTKV